MTFETPEIQIKLCVQLYFIRTKQKKKSLKVDEEVEEKKFRLRMKYTKKSKKNKTDKMLRGSTEYHLV